MRTDTAARQRFPVQIHADERISYLLIGLWVLFMIALPIALWTLGDEAFAPGINIAALLQAGAVFYIVQRQWGLPRTLISLLIIAVVTWGAEVIGHNTGLPFGEYVYTDVLQPQLAGVPLLIPIAWWMLLPSSWVMAQLIVGERNIWQKRALFVIVSAAALTAWDLFLDPQMVARNFWVWAQPSGYFGIPWSNYAGWLLVSAIVTLLVNPPRLNIMPLALIYGIVWFLQSVGQGIFWGQPGPALVGSLAMGSIMLLAYLRYRERQTP